MVTVLEKTPYEKKWLQLLNEEREVITLPVDFQTKEYTYGYVSFPLEERFVEDVDVIACYMIWLYHVSHQKTVTVGYWLHDKPLPISVEIDGEISYEQVKQSITEQISDIQTIGQEGFSVILGKLAEVQDEYPLFTTTVGAHIKEHQESFSLNLAIDKKTLHITFNAKQFKEGTIQRFAQQIVKLVNHSSNQTDFSVRKWSILTDQEMRLYKTINNTKTDFPSEKNIIDLFYETATKFPNRVALSSKEGAWKYSELNRKSNQIARMLLQNGVQKDDFVGIFMNRGMNTVISLLSVLKAGAVYIPIDPEYPESRIQYIIQDSQAKILLTDELTGMYENVKTLSINDSTYYDVEDVKVEIHPDDVAYIIYTSGSTGKPKGTMLAHRGVVNLCSWMIKHYGLNEHDVFAQFPSFSFDASVWEIFAALFCGGNVYVLLEEQRLSVDEFAEAIYSAKATSIMAMATIFLNQIALYLPSEHIYKLASLKRIAIGGEMLTTEVVKLWRQRIGNHIQLNNVYGPTECTVVTTTCPIPEQIDENLVSIPIGKPAGNYKVFILDENMNICPIKVPGELYVESVGLAVGYHNNIEKTNEVFVTHPKNPKIRLYKTGDVVRLLEDGNIEFLHRSDSQVKIRGHRIELGEIQKAIEKHEQIREAVVFTKKSEEGSHYLVAFYTTLTSEEMPELIHELKEQLPHYMVPSKLIFTNSLPLTPNKKVDVKLLAEMEEFYQPISLTEYVPPSTEAEREIAKAWSEVLGVEKIGVHDDFFTIGGHSLKVLRVLTLLKDSFPYITIQDFFTEKTIYNLARLEKKQAVCTRASFTGYKVVNEPHDIRCERTKEYRSVCNVLLTGATGYLGSHLLYELLQETKATIYCLVRPTSQVQQRVADTLKHYFKDNVTNEMLQRVIAVPGDLNEAQLGLTPADAKHIKETVDTIIHCGADVRHFGNASQFENVNINGTKRMLDLAEEQMRFHFISTIGIPDELARQQWEVYEETGDFNYNVTLENVYSNSKLQAENLVRQAIQNGLQGSIHRIGNLICHSQTGHFQRNIESNAFYRLMKTMLLLGASPNVNWKVDFTPVDFASKSLVTYIQDANIIGKTMHICHPEQLEFSVFVELINQCGYNLRGMSLEEYIDYGLQQSKQDEQLAELIASQIAGDGAQHTDIVFGTPKTTEWINKKQVNVPVINKEFMHRLISHSIQVDYFPHTSCCKVK